MTILCFWSMSALHALFDVFAKASIVYFSVTLDMYSLIRFWDRDLLVDERLSSGWGTAVLARSTHQMSWKGKDLSLMT